LQKKEKQTINYEVLVGSDVPEGNYQNIAILTAGNHAQITAESIIEVRLPEVKGEETVKEEPPKLPHTGIDSFVVFIFISSAVLLLGVLGLASIFLKKHRLAIQLILFGVLIIGGLVALSYPFWPLLKYQKVSLEDNGQDSALPVAGEIKIEGDYLLIPKIGVKMPIIEGKDESVMEKGAWLMPDGSLPGQAGNAILAGHRYKYKPPSEETFYLLDKLSPGDLIRVFWQGEEYRYSVVWSKVVKPEATEILENTEKPCLTLITCHPLFSDKERLIIRAEIL